MKVRGGVLTFIVIWQLLIVLFALSVIIVRAQNNELLQNRRMYLDYESWSESSWHEIGWYPDYYQEFKDIEGLVTNIYILSVTPITITGCIGLILRRNWGRILSMSSMGMTVIFFAFTLVSASLMQETEITNSVFIDVIALVLFSQTFIVLSILSLLYLNRSQVKEYFI